MIADFAMFGKVNMKYLKHIYVYAKKISRDQNVVTSEIQKIYFVAFSALQENERKKLEGLMNINKGIALTQTTSRDNGNEPEYFVREHMKKRPCWLQ